MQDTLRRLTVMALLAANTDAGDNIFSPGDWPTNEDTMPAILVNAGNEDSISGARAQANFTTTSIIEVKVKVLANSAEKARNDIMALRAQIRAAVCTNYAIMVLLQQIATINTTTEFNSDGGRHIGYAKIDFGMEFFEVPETPVNPVNMDTIALNVDLGNVFDPNGVYPNPPFPASVTAPPRASGPDGRNEGLLIVDLTQT